MRHVTPVSENKVIVIFRWCRHLTCRVQFLTPTISFRVVNIVKLVPVYKKHLLRN